MPKKNSFSLGIKFFFLFCVAVFFWSPLAAESATEDQVTQDAAAGENADADTVQKTDAMDPSVYQITTVREWDARVVKIEIRYNLRAAGLKIPSARLTVQRIIESQRNQVLSAALFSMRLDSHRTIGSSLEGNTEITKDYAGRPEATVAIEALSDITREMRLTETFFSKKQDFFIMRYELPFSALLKLYINPDRKPDSYPVFLGKSPTKEYSGIVIYATGELPIYGENVSGKLNPALFPKIYDTDIKLFASQTYIDQNILLERGVVSYAKSFTPAAQAIVGTNALRIVAKGIYGINRTDIVIDQADVARILSLPENQKLIEQGKILVISDTVSETVKQ